MSEERKEKGARGERREGRVERGEREGRVERGEREDRGEGGQLPVVALSQLDLPPPVLELTGICGQCSQLQRLRGREKEEGK